MTTPGFADVWPLTPMQEGLAFHTRYGQGGSDVYTVQLVLELAGRLDPNRLRRGLQTLLDRHPNLRAAAGEWAAVYASGGAEARWGGAPPSRDCRAGLARQDAAGAGEAWGQALAGAEPTHLAPVDPGRAPLMPEQVGVDLPAGLTAE